MAGWQSLIDINSVLQPKLYAFKPVKAVAQLEKEEKEDFDRARDITVVLPPNTFPQELQSVLEDIQRYGFTDLDAMKAHLVRTTTHRQYAHKGDHIWAIGPVKPLDDLAPSPV